LNAPARGIQIKEGGSGGNVAYRLDELGLKVGLAAPISSDLVGSILKSLIKNKHPGLRLYPIDEEVQEPCIVVSIIGRHGARRPYFKTNRRIRHLSYLESLSQSYSAMHISGYIIEQVSPGQLYRSILRIKKNCGDIILSFDLFPRLAFAPVGGEFDRLLRCFDFLFGTSSEFRRLTGLPRIHDLVKRFDGSGPELIIKRGSKGATVAKAGKLFFSRATRVEAQSLKGAGDAFVARYLASRLCGEGIQSSLVAANNYAADVIGRAGPSSKSDLQFSFRG
jgi:2-dehydro-3-deoxygluconokinase